VLFVWLVMLTAALALVAVYGSNVPSWDDWDIVPAVTGHQPVTLKWLWSQHNEHRVPLPRLLLLGMMRLIRMDFRIGMYFNVLTTGVLALGMILAARRVRGTSSYLDAFFPIVLMNWGQAANLLWCWQVQFYASTFLAGAVLILIARAATPLKLMAATAAGTCVVLLPLCGANGVGLVPPLALWLGYTAVLQWRGATPAGRRDAIILLSSAVAALMLTGFYFVGYNRVPYHPSTHSLRVILKTALQFLTMGFGPGVVGLGFESRLPMPFWKIVCSVVAGLFLLTGGMLVTAWRKHPTERARAAGFLLFLAAMASLALGLGMGRDGFESRYITLSVPALCAVYLAWRIYAAPRFQPLVRIVLFATAVMVLPPNAWWGLRYARDLKSHLAAFEADMVAGIPPYELIQHYAKYLHPHQIIVMDYMPFLRESGIGAFRRLHDDPHFREVPLLLTAGESDEAELENGVALAKGSDGWLTFTLPGDVEAAGIRLRYTYSNAKGTEPYLAIRWKSSNESDFAEDSWTKFSPTGDRANWRQGTWSRLSNELTTLDVWVCRPVQTLRIWPAIKIYELTLIVPPDVDARQ
jgi:hypothetical protein